MEHIKRISKQRHVRRLGRIGRHPVAVPFLTFGFLFALSAVGYLVFVDRGAPAVDKRVVIVTDNGAEQIVPSEQPTVGKLIAKMHITLGKGDVIEPAASTPINQDDFRINIYRAVPVQVVDSGQSKYTFSAATTPRSVARQTGSDLYPEDIVTTQPTDNFLKQGAIGEQVVIDRATPVNVNLYGTPKVIRTHAKTVGELVKEKGITLESSDQVTPAPSTPIVAGQQVLIARQGTRLESVTQTIAMPVQTITDPNLAYGTSAVRQQGSAGQQTVTYQINLTNGQAVSKTVVSTVVTQEPVTQIVVQGSSISGIKGDMARAGIAASDYDSADYIITHESNWNPNARNASGAYGLCQALPGSKMASAGSDWATNPVTQLKWCDGYAKGHYGGWAAAESYWRSHHYW